MLSADVLQDSFMFLDRTHIETIQLTNSLWRLLTTRTKIFRCFRRIAVERNLIICSTESSADEKAFPIGFIDCTLIFKNSVVKELIFGLEVNVDNRLLTTLLNDLFVKTPDFYVVRFALPSFATNASLYRALSQLPPVQLLDVEVLRRQPLPEALNSSFLAYQPIINCSSLNFTDVSFRCDPNDVIKWLHTVGQNKKPKFFNVDLANLTEPLEEIWEKLAQVITHTANIHNEYDV
jgi:hypothetical protein